MQACKESNTCQMHRHLWWLQGKEEQLEDKDKRNCPKGGECKPTSYSSTKGHITYKCTVFT